MIDSCECTDFVNDSGFGNCEREFSGTGNKKACYVALPTTCPDAVNSNSDPGKKLSALACTARKYLLNGLYTFSGL